MSELLWRAPARVSVSGPADWAPAEQVDVHHRDGDAVVRVETWPVGPDADVDGLAATHFQGGEHVVKDSGLGPAVVLGSADGRTRHVATTGADGSGLQVTLEYAVRQGRFFAVTRVVPASDARKAEEAAAIAGSISVAAPADLDVALLPVRGEAAGFEPLHDSWVRGDEDGVPGVGHVITVEESFAAARHHGVAMLPGTDTTGLGTLDLAQRELVAGVAWRSLEARMDAELREALALAASHDVIFVVSTRRGAATSTEWYAARPDRMVRIRRTDVEGQLLLTVHDTAALATLVVDDSLAGDTITASSVFRYDGRVVGHEQTWDIDLDGDASTRVVLEKLLPTPQNQENPS